MECQATNAVLFSFKQITQINSLAFPRRLCIVAKSQKPTQLFGSEISAKKENTMERDPTGSVTAEKTEPASSLRKNSDEDTCDMNSYISRDSKSGTADVAKARWTLLKQV